MIIIFSGPSGVGKSTIINNLSNDFNFYFLPHIQQDLEGIEIEVRIIILYLKEFNSMISNDEFLE